jgi:predicted transcriptional regulator
MKTAISIPDDVFRRAERLAKARKMSRSQLYTVAILRMLEAEPKADLTRAYDAAFADDHRDGFVDDAGRATLLDVEWSE